MQKHKKHWEVVAALVAAACLAIMVVLLAGCGPLPEPMEPIVGLCVPTCDALHESCDIAAQVELHEFR